MPKIISPIFFLLICSKTENVVHGLIFYCIAKLQINSIKINHKLSVFRHIPRKPSGQIQNFVNDSAYRLVRAQEENMVLKPWVLLASLLLQDHHQSRAAGHKRGMPIEDLTAQAMWLRDVSRQYGAFLHWPGKYDFTRWCKSTPSKVGVSFGHCGCVAEFSRQLYFPVLKALCSGICSWPNEETGRPHFKIQPHTGTKQRRI